MEVKELQKIELNILKWVDEICRKNNIKYFLYAGTLIGAIRHQGFIPWDDDIDIGMLRSDYDKFIELFRNNNSERYRMVAPEITPGYLYPFAKIVDTKTRLIEKKTDCGVDMGLYIDVFPLDAVPEDIIMRKKLIKQHLKYEGLLMYSMSRNHGGKGFKLLLRHFLNIYIKFVGKEHFRNKIIKLMSKQKYANSKMVGVIALSCQEFDMGLKEWFADTTDVKFEGEYFMVPVGWKEYLTKRYGDFMMLPPEDQRVSNHDFDVEWIEKPIS